MTAVDGSVWIDGLGGRPTRIEACRYSSREREGTTMAFFSSRLGVVGSIAVSVIGTIVLFVLFNLIS